MSGVFAGMPHAPKLFIAALLITACLVPGIAAAASSLPRSCHSADLRYPFMPGGPDTFGVFGLTIANGSCTTAHRVAKAWMSRFEAAFRAGHFMIPRSVDGFRFTMLDVDEAQAFRERGRMGSTTLWFDYRIPNG